MTSLVSVPFLEMFSIPPEDPVSVQGPFPVAQLPGRGKQSSGYGMCYANNPKLWGQHHGAFSLPEVPSVTRTWPPSLAWIVPHVLTFLPGLYACLTSQQPSHQGGETGPVVACLSCLDPWTQAIGWPVHIPAPQSVSKGWDTPV